ncbi:hypothetical protein L195_g009108 [Trifolium pratense]|uniref:Uncharacterized protein n=1 Tax=Trifolium pratense TaxID=57577 RepID=A0A2K3PB24_TRIPR|nr:hypothetical protein L195_g009108 [Trifolium pratense]
MEVVYHQAEEELVDFLNRCKLNNNEVMHMLKYGFIFKIDTVAKINDVWQNGMWNLQHLYTPFPNNVVIAITTFQPKIVQHLSDVWTWSNSSSGMYSVKDAYNWLLNLAPLNEHVNW